MIRPIGIDLFYFIDSISVCPRDGGI